MNEHFAKEDILCILAFHPELAQRDLSGNLGISLGKTNYFLKEVAKKGLLKPKNFTCRGGKIRKVKYILPKRDLKKNCVLSGIF